MIQLIAFLGNYGREYENTRHNTAWLFEKSLPFANKISYQSKYKSDFYAADYDQVAVWLKDAGLIKERDNGSLPVPENHPPKLYFMKPMTYMNLSGEAIGEAARFFKIPASDILIVHDEIELPLGTCGFKFGGGLGGHNGLRSAKTVLGTQDFFRLRFGVGKSATMGVADYVLGNFSSDEQIVLSQVFPQVHQWLAKILISKAPENLCQGWNKKNLVPEVK